MEINLLMEINYFSKNGMNPVIFNLSIYVHLISALLNQIIFNLGIYVHLCSGDRTNSISLPCILLFIFWCSVNY